MKYTKKKFLFCGKKNDKHSKSIISFLRKKNIKLNVILTGEKLNHKNVSRLIYKKEYDYMFFFRSKIILKLNKLSKNCLAINFHPGPPEYRGIGCVNFAILNEEKYYGATAHLMSNKIDNGPILLVDYFKISKNNNINSILNKTYKLQLNQIKKITSLLIEKKNKKININSLKKNKFKWSKKIYLRKDLQKLYNLSNNIKKYNLDLLLRSTMTKKFKPYFKNKIYNLKISDI